jgi:Pol polyprotein
VAGGGGNVKVHGFGTVVIRPKGATPNIDCELTLNDVAYVPEFPVNLVSYDKAMSKGIYWNGEEKTLVKDGKTICKVEREYDQWLLEYNPISASAFAISSESPVSKLPTPESPTTESNEDKVYDPRFPFIEETFMEKSPRNQVTVELPFHPYQKLRNTGESESESESEASESESETELSESSIREVENEEEIDEFFDTPESHLTYDHQLITPEATPDREGIDETHTWEEEIPLQVEEMPVTTVERQPRFEIRGDVSTDNIIEGTRVRRRREAYITELGQPDE